MFVECGAQFGQMMVRFLFGWKGFDEPSEVSVD